MQIKTELNVIMKAKDLCQYIMVITQKCPKQFRHTFANRLQNMSMDILQDIYFANDIYIEGLEEATDRELFSKRLSLQREAMAKLNMLAYIAQLALEQKAILPKQYKLIAQSSTDVIFMLAAWRKSDKEKMKMKKGKYDTR